MDGWLSSSKDKKTTSVIIGITGSILHFGCREVIHHDKDMLEDYIDFIMNIYKQDGTYILMMKNKFLITYYIIEQLYINKSQMLHSKDSVNFFSQMMVMLAEDEQETRKNIQYIKQIAEKCGWTINNIIYNYKNKRKTINDIEGIQLTEVKYLGTLHKCRAIF